MKSGRQILFVVLLMLMIVPVALAQDEEELRQWATSATASSEFTDDAYNAMQATGEPTLEECGDSPEAWASLGQDTEEDLTVYFDRPVSPTQINIYQTFTPGAITGIELIPYSGDDNITVRNSADPGTDCPGVFTIDIGVELPLVYGVKINLDQSETKNWNEIDAVELVGIPDPDILSVEESSETTEEEEEEVVEEPVEISPLAGYPLGRSVNCDDGGQFDNGQEYTVIQMRPNSNYTVTAVGLNGFDPMLAVLGEGGTGLCSDDTPSAAYYSAYLPTTGEVDASNYTAQVSFNTYNQSTFSNITLVVGGRENGTGSYILIVEGMFASAEDGVGDIFSVKLSAGMIASGVPLSVYQFAVTNVVDVQIATVDGDYNFVRDADKNYVYCGNAGDNSTCWGTHYSMVGSWVARSEGRYLEGGRYDAMMSMELVPEDVDKFYNFAMRTESNTAGDYIAVFHAAIGQP